LDVTFLPIWFIAGSKNRPLNHCIGQGWAISGPRTTFVPPQRIQCPRKHSRKIFKCENSSHLPQ